jgi:hypothetical protein
MRSFLALVCLLTFTTALAAPKAKPHKHEHGKVTLGDRSFVPVKFTVRSVRSGRWSDAKSWQPARVPRAGDKVLIGRETRIEYDANSEAVIRMVQVVGTLSFSRTKDTLLNVGILKVQNSSVCSETGFACDFADVSPAGEPFIKPPGTLPALEIGTADRPIPAGVTARVRLHYFKDMDRNDAPALAACSARMDIHGAPMSRTWVDLGKSAAPGDVTVVLSEAVTGWNVGDEVIVTGSKHNNSQGGQYRHDPELTSTEKRTIKKIDGTTLTLDAPLKHEHFGTGKFRSEVANLSRNVVIESADPDGVRGHTMFHRFSRGSISYARFAHLGKEGVLGRYTIHFHLVANTMRGSSVVGAALVDSHNRWITVHGTNYMVVRDCVGYRSVGHGFFLEDGTEVYTVFDRNLGVQAFKGRRLPKQVLPFDPNDGGAFWWANGRNTFVRNTACENDQYGFRYDSQKRSNFDSNLPVQMPDGKERKVDIRTLPIYRFEDNETHTEGLYGMTLAGTDGVGPDTKHPHVLRGLKIWQVHYALRVQIPTMLIENVEIDHGHYGIYRPLYDNHVYRNLHIASTNTEPFNRGLDDRSTQPGSITVDGLTFSGVTRGGMPLIQMSDNNPSGRAESHFRNVKVTLRRDGDRRALVDRGGGSQVSPTTSTSVPVFLHDYFGPGRHAKVMSTHAKDFPKGSDEYREEAKLTGRDSRVREVRNVKFPKLLDPTDDQPPATIITYPTFGVTAKRVGDVLVIRGTTTDNERTRRVTVNGVPARDVDYNFHLWEVRLKGVKPGKLTLVAQAEDAAGNVEQTPHRLTIEVE